MKRICISKKENFKMVFGVSKDESILEREKGQGIIFLLDSRWNNMNLIGSSPGDRLRKMWGS